MLLAQSRTVCTFRVGRDNKKLIRVHGARGASSVVFLSVVVNHSIFPHVYHTVEQRHWRYRTNASDLSGGSRYSGYSQSDVTCLHGFTPGSNCKLKGMDVPYCPLHRSTAEIYTM